MSVEMKKMPKVILLIETSRSPGRELLSGISRYSNLYGPWRFYREPSEYIKPTIKIKSTDQLKDFQPDGIITRDLGPEQNQILNDFDVPVVSVIHFKSGLDGVYPVVSDDRQIGEMAAEYVMQKGFVNFAFCGFEEMMWSQQRGGSFAERIRKAGFEVAGYRQSEHLKRQGRDREIPVLSEWLRSLLKPVAVLTCNDDRGQDVIEACQLAGLKIPAEVAVLGIDNDEFVCEFLNVSLSSVALNFERAGFEAAGALDALMKGRPPKQPRVVIKPLHVVTRRSTDILAIEDEEVSKAIRFIQENARDNIQVQDVVNAVAISRRGLQQKFKVSLGTSIHKVIKRFRTDQIAKMLVNSNIPILEIALSLGFPGVEHIARYFRQEKGMSPVEYRRKYGRA